MDAVSSTPLLSIGEFARLGGVTVKALRLYAELGLLPPASVRAQSGYRLYRPAQLSRLHRILLLKSTGISLAQIGEQLDGADGVSLPAVREALKTRIEEFQRQLSWVEAEIAASETGRGGVAALVALKRIPQLTVTARRERIENYAQADVLLQELRIKAPHSTCLVPGTIWHDCGAKSSTIDCEAFWVTDGRGSKTVACQKLAPVTVASVLHSGPDSTIGIAYEGLHRWSRDNAFEVAGPNREIYVSPSGTDGLLTEIQLPIKRRA